MYDIVIIGAGPAGLTAALYAARKDYKVALVSEDIGGQVNWAGNVENYPGLGAISGVELAQKIAKPLSQYKNLKKILSNSVGKIKKSGNGFQVLSTNGGEIVAGKAVILATGAAHRKLNVPGEAELTGKGVAYCATCDAPLFKNKTVAVIGGGNSALDAVMDLLAAGAKKVFLINRTEKFNCEEIRLDRAKKSAKVEIITNAETTRLIGTQKLEGLEYKLAKGMKRLAIEGAFIEIGLQPSTGFLKGFVTLDERGQVKINNKNETNVPGVYAAGDCTNIGYKQMIIAAGEGAKATLAAAEYLSK